MNVKKLSRKEKLKYFQLGFYHDNLDKNQALQDFLLLHNIEYQEYQTKF